MNLAMVDFSPRDVGNNFFFFELFFSAVFFSSFFGPLFFCLFVPGLLCLISMLSCCLYSAIFAWSRQALTPFSHQQPQRSFSLSSLRASHDWALPSTSYRTPPRTRSLYYSSPRPLSRSCNYPFLVESWTNSHLYI